ncbi:MAG: hypothetical protein EOP22_16640 [Hyphomicrobiales bacterium]|nr:MAG: hypothetical protein EOP22_16640 [Hyphomicrobiales bacterium]
MLKHLTIAAITLGAIGAAHAASGDAWDEFYTEVEQGCIAAAAPILANATAIVDPFGTESYGVAIVTGETVAGTKSVLCVMNKQSRVFEIGGELDITVTSAEAAE